FVTLTGSNGEVMKFRSSSRVTVQYLNIREGRIPVDPANPLGAATRADDGIDIKLSTASRAFCNCILHNEEGLDVDGGSRNQVGQNLVKDNENGIRASASAKWVRYRSNPSMNNDLPQTDTASDPAGRRNGLIMSVSTTANNFEGNLAVNDA